MIPTEIPIAVELTPAPSSLVLSPLVELSVEELGPAELEVLSPLPFPPVLEGFLSSDVTGGLGFVVEEVTGKGEGLGP